MTILQEIHVWSKDLAFGNALTTGSYSSTFAISVSAGVKPQPSRTLPQIASDCKRLSTGSKKRSRPAPSSTPDRFRGARRRLMSCDRGYDPRPHHQFGRGVHRTRRVGDALKQPVGFRLCRDRGGILFAPPRARDPSTYGVPIDVIAQRVTSEAKVERQPDSSQLRLRYGIATTTELFCERVSNPFRS